MGGSQADIAGIAAIAEIAHERQKNKFCRQKVNEGRWAGKSKIIISICRGVMYGPDIVLHSENMAAPAMQENSPHPPFPGELPVCFSVMVFELMCMELNVVFGNERDEKPCVQY